MFKIEITQLQAELLQDIVEQEIIDLESKSNFQYKQRVLSSLRSLLEKTKVAMDKTVTE